MNELPKRKNTRLKNYDYSSNGCYFITICTKEKVNYFGRKQIVGNGAHTVPKIILSDIGMIVDKHIKRIDVCYPNVTVDNYIIMPNHIHALIFIKNDGVMRASHPTNLSTIIRTLKTMVTREVGYSIWQSSYYDEIIKSQNQYENCWSYIEYNALKEYK